VDFNASSSTDGGHTWTTTYTDCCADRVASQIDPLGAGETYDYDGVGNVIHTSTVGSDAATYRESTTRYDSHRRPIARTVWLNTLANLGLSVDEQTPPPIAGRWGVGVTRDSSGNATNGLTTQWCYVDNLALLASSANPYSTTQSANQVTLHQLTSDGSDTATLTVDLGGVIGSNLIQNSYFGAGAILFNAGAAGTAVITVNPAQEVSVTVNDAIGRRLATAVLAPASGVYSQIVTWRLRRYDMGNPVSMFSSTGGLDTNGTTVETQEFESNQSGTGNPANFVGTYTDGAGRAIARTVPSQAMWSWTGQQNPPLTAMQYDANGNLLSVLDPNNVGWYASTATSLPPSSLDGYDALNRLTRKIDTASQATSYTYDLNGNRLTLTDASGNVTTWTYDARDRASTESINVPTSVSSTNHLSRVFEYDGLGNTVVRGGRDGLARAFGYNAVNQLETEGWYATTSDGEAAARTGAVGSNATYTITIGHDAAHRTTSATDDKNPGGTATPTFSYTYNYPASPGLGDRVQSIANPLREPAPWAI
jgi:YD repeat-containing protein